MTEEHTTDNDRLTITLKYGGDYAAPWTVIRGDTAEQTKQAIIDLLGGLKDETVSKDWDLATLVASASIILQDRYNQATKDYVNKIANQENDIIIDRINKATSKAQLADLLPQPGHAHPQRGFGGRCRGCRSS